MAERKAEPKSKPNRGRRRPDPRRKRFVEEYLVDPTPAWRVAERAGYKGTNGVLRATACRLLADSEIQEAIGKATEERAQRTQITQDYVITTIKETIDRCRQGVPAVVTREDGPTLEWTFNAQGVLRGCELLGKHLGMFKERHEHTGADGGAIRHEHVLTDEMVQRLIATVREDEAEVLH